MTAATATSTRAWRTIESQRLLAERRVGLASRRAESEEASLLHATLAGLRQQRTDYWDKIGLRGRSRRVHPRYVQPDRRLARQGLYQPDRSRASPASLYCIPTGTCSPAAPTGRTGGRGRACDGQYWHGSPPTPGRDRRSTSLRRVARPAARATSRRTRLRYRRTDLWPGRRSADGAGAHGRPKCATDGNRTRALAAQCRGICSVPSHRVRPTRARKCVFITTMPSPISASAVSIAGNRQRVAIGDRPRQLAAPIAVDEPVYRIRVVPNSQAVAAFGERHPLQPGMSLTANVILDRRSFLAWLLTPLNAVLRRNSDA